jgi:hypothetical protein
VHYNGFGFSGEKNRNRHYYKIVITLLWINVCNGHSLSNGNILHGVGRNDANGLCNCLGSDWMIPSDHNDLKQNLLYDCNCTINFDKSNFDASTSAFGDGIGNGGSWWINH